MGKRFEGKVALVTGAGGGIGTVIAEKLAEYGADIVIVDIKFNEKEDIIRKIQGMGRKAIGLKIDITDVSAVRKELKDIISEVGKIDFLVNNAGAYPSSPILEVEEEQYDFVMDVNLKGMFFVTQTVVRESMLKNRYGKIVNISSIDGKKPAAGVSVYGAAKAGVIAMTNSYALELARMGINCNCVAPGWVESTAVLSSDRWKTFVKQIPAQRLGKLSEIAEAVCFLCDDNVSFINGETIDVNGGQIMD